MPSLETITVLLTHYGYLLLFPIAIVEGPIITIIAAFLASRGYMNLWIVYGIVVAADIFGDFVFYALGRWNISFIRRHGHFFGITEKSLERAEAYYSRHHYKSIIISKTVHGIGVGGIVAAGALKVPYWKFFRIAILVSLIQSAAFLGIGFFLGNSYVTIGKYLNYIVITLTLIIVATASFFFYKSRNKK